MYSQKVQLGFSGGYNVSIWRRSCSSDIGGCPREALGILRMANLPGLPEKLHIFDFVNLVLHKISFEGRIQQLIAQKPLIQKHGWTGFLLSFSQIWGCSKSEIILLANNIVANNVGFTFLQTVGLVWCCLHFTVITPLLPQKTQCLDHQKTKRSKNRPFLESTQERTRQRESKSSLIF